MSNFDLYHECRNNDTEAALKLLNSSSEDLDILYEDGSFLIFAISKNNVELCSALIEYFEKKQFLNKKGNYEAQDKKNHLCEIIDESFNMYGFSTEMKQILSKYVHLGDSEMSSSVNKENFVGSLDPDYINAKNKEDTFTVAPDNFVISDKHLIKHHDDISTDVSVNSNNQFTYEYKPLITNAQDDIDVKYNDLNNNTTSEKNLHDSINTADTFGIGEQQNDEENEVQVLGGDFDGN